MHFLGDLNGWNRQRGVLHVHIPADSETKRMRVLIEKYSDTPMDLADASLVAAAESRGIDRIFTLDKIVIFASTDSMARLRSKWFDSLVRALSSAWIRGSSDGQYHDERWKNLQHMQ